ncbi:MULTISPECIES: hypothetical protein [unclassified Bradyrhizobium]|uniref:hypothetical protein n=1 Tax=unclassified Bradyrhizobium TaxID=2631580 RepID=UPI0028ED493C|nr:MULTISPECIES: hypothetical protein [unclassified Bradyrhizobium]
MNQDEEVVRHAPGIAKVSELKAALSDAWKNEILAKPTELKKAAEVLGVDPNELKSLISPPLAIQSERAGMTGGEVLIVMAIWAGNEIVLGAFKDLAKEQLKNRLKQLWSVVLEPLVRDLLEDRRYGLGPQIDEKKKNE